MGFIVNIAVMEKIHGGIELINGQEMFTGCVTLLIIILGVVVIFGLWRLWEVYKYGALD